MINLIGVL